VTATAPVLRPRLRRALFSLGTVVAALLAAPILAPFDPSRQFDPAVGRHLPPGSRRYLVELSNSREILAEEIVWDPETLSVRRDGQIHKIPVTSLRSARDSSSLVIFVLGTDRLGRDCLSRLLFAGRHSLLIATLATTLAGIIGVGVGAISGLSDGLLGTILMRAIDFMLSFPQLFIVLLGATLFDSGPGALVLTLGATTWMPLARIVRAEIRDCRKQPFIEAAIAIGCRPSSILRRHLLPQALHSAAVVTMLALGDIVLLESALSYLGLGISPPTPTWGRIIAGGSAQIGSAWWVVTFPGLALVGTVLTINLTGDSVLLPLPRHGGSALHSRRSGAR
jgi:peptide/nickel transport system permease protein